MVSFCEALRTCCRHSMLSVPLCHTDGMAHFLTLIHERFGLAIIQDKPIHTKKETVDGLAI